MIHPDRPALLVEIDDLNHRSGSFGQARIAAGIEQLSRRLLDEDDEESFVACVSALQAAAREIGRTRILSAQKYMQWRSAHLEDMRGARGGVLPPPPEWNTISEKFGTWPRALLAAGLISPREATDYDAGGKGQHASDAHIARWLCAAATELGSIWR